MTKVKITDFIWDWASQNEKELIWKLFAFGEALEFLASDSKLQVEKLEGECPFIEAWYGCCHEVLSFREKLNNHSIPSFYDKDLLDALDVLSCSFDDLTEEECVEGVVAISNLDGWCKIRELSKPLLYLIEWAILKEWKDDIYKML